MSKLTFNKKVAMLLIQIIVVAMALVLTVGTYAWYTSQTSVEVTQTTVTAAAGANTTIKNVEEEENPAPYWGQTGTGYGKSLDVPYTRTVTVTANFEPTQADNYLTIKLTSMTIARNDGSQTSSSTNPEILDSFTWRAYVYDEEEDEWTAYRPEIAYRVVDESEVKYFTGFAEESKVVLGEGETREKCAIQANTDTQIRIVLVFLDEDSLRAREAYLAGDEAMQNQVKEFDYCDYENMRAVFTCTIEVGFDSGAV